jgi:hypothetical protein
MEILLIRVVVLVQKGRIVNLCERSDLLGKKARGFEISVVGDNFICLKSWMSQLQELEDLMLQEEGPVGSY